MFSNIFPSTSNTIRDATKHSLKQQCANEFKDLLGETVFALAKLVLLVVTLYYAISRANIL